MTGDRTEATTDPRDELEIEKLRLEIRDLSAPWWKRPSYMASVATMSAALLGFTWGALSGYFDVSRRELEIKKHDLRADIDALAKAQDKRAKQFENERRQQQQTILALQLRAKELQTAVAALDVPVVIDAAILDAPWRSSRAAQVRIRFSGTNLGAVALGSGTLNLNCATNQFGWVSKDKPVRGIVVESTKDYADVAIPPQLLKRQYQTAFTVNAPPDQALLSLRRCGASMALAVSRPDGRASNSRVVSLEEAVDWLSE